MNDFILINREVDNSDENNSDYYASAHKMTSLLHSLTESLNISKDLSIFILNPNPPTVETTNKTYGYRSGFSSEEMTYLRKALSFLVLIPVST
jgi:hypothetical protein